ncbi:MAG TPA: ABC transporter substrate-binding protein [Pseudolysinimonas sp.]|nr:ABC transporter substrate-binding protein [Pseudolysinimonas sp.]
MKRRTAASLAVLGVVAALLAGCAPSAPAPTATATDDTKPAAELRLGYFANVTHAPALVGLEKGFFEDSLGKTKLTTQIFNAGPATIEALSAGAIDAAYIGPSPAINSYIKSKGESAVIVAGATTGGAALVVRDGIKSVADLKGTTLATPQLGNTQDVALRSYLADHDLKTSISGGGDVTIQPTENADTLTLFQKGELDGAWLPEPWVSRLVIDGGAHVLVDEASLWPKGDFPTTVLLVNKKFLAEHPKTVTALLKGHIASINWLNKNPNKAGAVINDRLTADTGKPLADEVIKRALTKVSFSLDPVASTFPKLVKHAVDAGTGTDGDITGLFDFRLVNALLTEDGQEPISAGKLGQD